MMHTILTMLKHFFLMSWIVLFVILMNILLVSSFHLRYWNNFGCMFLKFHCNIKQLFVVSKKWRILKWNSIVVYKKPISAPYVAFLIGLTSFITYLQIYSEKKLFNDVPNFKIGELNFQVIQRFTLTSSQVIIFFNFKQPYW